MKRNWYVVANRTETRIFEQEGLKPQVDLVQTITNPKGRLQNSELDSDRQGVISRRPGQGFNQYQPRVDSRQRELEIYVKQLIAELGAAERAQKFDQLILVAEPHLLGLLRQNLTPPLAKRLRSSVTKDLAYTPPREMSAALGDSLFVRGSSLP